MSSPAEVWGLVKKAMVLLNNEISRYDEFKKDEEGNKVETSVDSKLEVWVQT